MLEAIDVGDRAVDPGQFAHGLQGFAPARPQAAVFARDDQRQQAAAAQRVALGLRGTAGDVALGGVLGEIGGQAPGDLQRRLRLGAGLRIHRGFLLGGPAAQAPARAGSTSLAIISPNGPVRLVSPRPARLA
ncbi:Uncharacterised protein [Acinetobacter baumannii]|nr:Uncharacterised protein [Acinetobacter baumannii]